MKDIRYSASFCVAPRTEGNRQLMDLESALVRQIFRKTRTQQRQERFSCANGLGYVVDPDWEPQKMGPTAWDERPRVTSAKGRDANLKFELADASQERRLRNEALEALGLGPDSMSSSPSSEEIRSAYRRRALQAHPDKGGSAAEWECLSAAFATLMGAAV